MGYKVYIAIVLWRLGLRKILPSGYVNKKQIRDNDSPLVDLSKDPAFSMDERALRRGGMWVRSEMAPILHNAAQKLPDGIKLHFFGGWRHIAVQWTAWEDNLANKRKEFPNATDADVMRIARMTSADPTRGGFGPHQTGGAIDLTLIKDGKELDMGTPFSYHGIECQTDFKGITNEQRKNRDLLRNALHDAGFINYPGEWWHYSYGDRAWATYGRKPFAVFGRINNPKYKLEPEEKQYTNK
jgi:D-alanyl-D-alanine dipeptidase